MEELKPCPFCGGKAEIKEYKDGSGGVKCSECNFEPLTHASYHRIEDKPKTIEWWNRRASDEKADATGIAELKGKLESLTPGGSEFHDDPDRCIQWVKARLASVTEQVKKRKEAEGQLWSFKRALELASTNVSEYMPCYDCPYNCEDINKPSCSKPASYNCMTALAKFYFQQAEAELKGGMNNA